MVDSNNSHFDTPFTVSIDLIGDGCSTGISAADRSKTVQALIDPENVPFDRLDHLAQYTHYTTLSH